MAIQMAESMCCEAWPQALKNRPSREPAMLFIVNDSWADMVLCSCHCFFITAEAATQDSSA